MFGTSWRVGRVAGIELRIDSSWAVIALLITYSMYLRLSVLYPELSGVGAVALAILSAVLFFGSVLVHELAHALVSQARGIRVQDITLFLFGGATPARVESRGPRDEFLIALVGPLTSGLLAGLFGSSPAWAVTSCRGRWPGRSDILPGPTCCWPPSTWSRGSRWTGGGCCARRSGRPPAASPGPPGSPR
jgi:hypothetical protein